MKERYDYRVNLFGFLTIAFNKIINLLFRLGLLNGNQRRNTDSPLDSLPGLEKNGTSL